MLQKTLMRRLERPGADKGKLASLVAGRPDLVSSLVSGLDAEKASVRFGCAGVLRALSEMDPEIVYPEIAKMVALLDCENKILKWGGIQILGNLARVDSRRRIDGILDKYLDPIAGPDLVTAANAIAGAAKIARARPRHADRVARAVMKVEKGRYKTAECRDIAIGKALDALDLIYDDTSEKGAVALFVRRQLRNKRAATRKKAERFIGHRLPDGGGRARGRGRNPRT